MPDLLLELFSEEIPARMQARAEADLARMHAGRNFFGEQFEEEVWHSALIRIEGDGATSAIYGGTQVNLLH